ncbi:hypothetical protein [Marinobacter salicampi]|uniref:hypothetical protein n=1 Tax=Marinobacter salicampi TaxID=435907 RepID=UPI00140E6878|nr:hypothetical protein [Marinobacter salicampi]
MLARHIKPMAFQARRLYVEAMFQVMGQALQAVSEIDSDVQGEARSLPEGFLFEMMVMPDGPRLIIEHLGNGALRFHGSTAPRDPDLSIQFKHIAHAFLVLSFQEKTSVAFANDRMLVDGDLGYAIRITRILNRLEAFILPRLVASRAVKEYPRDLNLPKKVIGAARIYLKVANQFVDTVRA